MTEKKIPLLIVGSGPAAYTASIYAGRAKIDHLIIAGDVKGGQLVTSLEVENYPGFPIVSGFELMDTLEKHAKKFGGELINDYINSVNFTARPFILNGKKHTYIADSVIIATGSSPRLLGLEKEDTLLGRGVSYCATCDGNFFKGQNVAVVGGGNTAVEEALYLSNIVEKVSLIHRRDTLRAEKILQDKLISKRNIDIIWDSKVTELKEDNNGLESLTIQNLKTSQASNLKVTGLFVAIGHIPNTSFLNNSIKLDEGGYIITNSNSTSTSCLGVFAAGDVQDSKYRQAITSAASGCMAAIDANMFLINNS